MPVTKTAKRALRSSKKKARVNEIILNKLEIAVRMAKKTKSKDKILKAVSMADIAKKKKAIHQNKAARIKSALSKLLTKQTKSTTPKKKSKKQSSK